MSRDFQRFLHKGFLLIFLPHFTSFCLASDSPNWLDGGQLDSSRLILSSRNGREGIGKEYDAMVLNSSILFWPILFLLGVHVLNSLYSRKCPKRFAKISDRNQINVILYTIELVMTTLGLVVQLVFGSKIVLAGSMHNRGSLDDFNDQLSWVGSMQNMLIVEGFCVIPMLTLYTFEMIVHSRSTNPVIMLHHLVVICSFTIAMQAVHQCAECAIDLWIQGWITLFHITLEQPYFIAMLLRRLEIRGSGLLLRILAGPYTPVYRGAVTASMLWAYVQACWCRSVYTPWHILWRYLCPVFVALIMVAQFSVWMIYRNLSKREQNECDANLSTDSRADKNLSKSSESVADVVPAVVIRLEEGAVAKEQDTMELVNASALVQECTGTPSTRAKAGDLIHLRDSSRRSQSSAHLGSRKSSRSNWSLHTGADSRLDDDSDSDDEAANQPNVRRPMHPSKGPFTRVAIWLAQMTKWLLIFGTLVVISTIQYWSMDCAPQAVQQQRVAIVGAGGSGLTASWMLARHSSFSVTVFERETVLGGAARTFYTNGTQSAGSIDLAFKSFKDYHNFQALLDHLDVDLAYSDMGLGNVFVQKDHEDIVMLFGRLGFGSEALYNVVQEISKFRQELFHAAATYSEADLQTQTIGKFLVERNYSKMFIEQVMPSCMSTYVGTISDDLEIPLSIQYFFEKHFSICTTLSRVSAFQVKGGVAYYIKKLADAVQKAGGKILPGVAIQKLTLEKGGINLFDDSNKLHSFDKVILATNNFAQYSKLLPQELDDYSLAHEMFSKVSQTEKWTMPHNNVSLGVPAILKDNTTGCWMIENYIHDVRRSVGQGTKVRSTTFQHVDSTRCYQHVPVPMNYFGDFDRDVQQSAIETHKWDFTVHDVAFNRVRRNMHKIQGVNGIFFAGSSIAVNLHEWAILSGLAVANQLGVAYPFEKNSMAKQAFLAMKQQMFYGIDFMIPPLAHGN